MFSLQQSVNQQVVFPSSDIELYIKREDKLHDYVSGNKYRKLKYNIEAAERSGLRTLLSFGGAYSNHISALASAGQILGLKTIGVIRGEELHAQIDGNPTLQFAKQCGMQFKFVSRSQYRLKTSASFLNDLKEEFGAFYLIPEGGTNALAVKGCEEILSEQDSHFDYICVSVGTGGTIAGIINCSKPGQQVLGFPALKGSFLHKDISKFVTKSNWKLVNDYHFGGYAKINASLVAFINRFKREYGIPLDPIYTGKMLFGVMDLINKGFFPKGSKILTIHTGGLQGIPGMNDRLVKKNLPKIII
ncbi:1-aminocyclopropane-1-carboxylate deaminase/D-cysteine desulfhydrase [Aestuariivivens sediminicola]|uniref:1-aminocyclopropane-1-carboxylate deaminase/D-cysteine desulfhydrase n=1 Tax=Aestuariivivens sediminicola TaxID=2913560 RepID=UPI001F562997|nr:pyridoxal-phosphate dependent enzyme [Aestuariivivens sediminicola]